MYQIYANLLPLLKHNLELIGCPMLSWEAYIFITCAYILSPFITFSICCVEHQANEYVLFNKINGLYGSFLQTIWLVGHISIALSGGLHALQVVQPRRSLKEPVVQKNKRQPPSKKTDYCLRLSNCLLNKICTWGINVNYITFFTFSLGQWKDRGHCGQLCTSLHPPSTQTQQVFQP